MSKISESEQTLFSFDDASSLFKNSGPVDDGALDRAEFERMDAIALKNRAQTITTLSTLTSIVAQQASPPFSFIDPHTTGLLALGYAIDSLRLLDIETSDLTVKELEARVAEDLRLQFTALVDENTIPEVPETKDIEIWAKGVVDKLLCKKEHGSSTERMFDTDSKQFYEFQHSLLEEYARGNAISPPVECRRRATFEDGRQSLTGGGQAVGGSGPDCFTGFCSVGSKGLIRSGLVWMY